MKLTEPQIRMLRNLQNQFDAAALHPADSQTLGKYSPELWIGTVGAPKHTCEALLSRGLAFKGANNHGFDTITINDAGRRALTDLQK